MQYVFPGTKFHGRNPSSFSVPTWTNKFVVGREFDQLLIEDFIIDDPPLVSPQLGDPLSAFFYKVEMAELINLAFGAVDCLGSRHQFASYGPIGLGSWISFYASGSTVLALL